MSGNRYDDLIDAGGGGREKPRRQARSAAPASTPARERPAREERREERTEPEAAVEGGVGVPDGVDGAGEAPAIITPSGEGFREWLDRGLRGERRPKDYSTPAISNYHADLIDECKRMVKELGYSRRQASSGNTIEMAIENHHADLVAHVAREGGRKG